MISIGYLEEIFFLFTIKFLNILYALDFIQIYPLNFSSRSSPRNYFHLKGNSFLNYSPGIFYFTVKQYEICKYLDFKNLKILRPRNFKSIQNFFFKLSQTENFIFRIEEILKIKTF